MKKDMSKDYWNGQLDYMETLLRTIDAEFEKIADSAHLTGEDVDREMEKKTGTK